MTIDQLKNIIFCWASENSLVRKVYIFGSRARGDYCLTSDLDVAIEVNQTPQDGSECSTWFNSRKMLKASLQALVPYQLQLEWYDPIETPTVHKGLQESSILVYEQPKP